MDKITQVLRIPIHYLLDDELPIEYHVSTSTDDGILLLSSEEIQFLMKYRDLEPHSKRAVDTMTELLNMPPGRLAGNSAGQADLLLCNRSSRGLQPIG